MTEQAEFGIPRFMSRRWIAWRLIQLAYRIHDADFDDSLTIYVGGRKVAEIGVLGNTYGNGVTSGHVLDTSVSVYNVDCIDGLPLIGRPLGGSND